MNKTLALSAFVMFAVIMGMSAIAPAMADRGGEPSTAPCDNKSNNDGKKQGAGGEDQSQRNDLKGKSQNKDRCQQP